MPNEREHEMIRTLLDAGETLVEDDDFIIEEEKSTVIIKCMPHQCNGKHACFSQCLLDNDQQKHKGKRCKYVCL